MAKNAHITPNKQWLKRVSQIEIDASLLAMCERATAKLRRDLKKQKRKK